MTEKEQTALEKSVRVNSHHSLYDSGFSTKEQENLSVETILQQSAEFTATPKQLEDEEQEYLRLLEEVADIASRWDADPNEVADDAQRIVNRKREEYGLEPIEEKDEP